MGLAKKGSAKIRVDERDYRWVVSPNDGVMELVVQEGSGKGRRLAIAIDYDDERHPIPGGFSVTPRRQITPGLVRNLILQAIGLGWQSDARGKTVSFRLKGDRLTGR
ncbi:MAG: hypothetical protein EHM91_17840 [Planctomycetota bacterium]|nr:MAG: hypothetical protein EHM91_17840 [Planctomycetota bacterium]